MVANLGGLSPHFLVNPGRGCSSRSSLFVNRSNLSKSDLKRSVIRSEVRQAHEEYLQTRPELLSVLE